MKVEEVPQDKSSLKNAKTKELCYAVNKDGKYVTKLSDGWDVKTIALNKSLELIEERKEHFKTEFLKGKISPIPYYMEVNRMDLNVLASYMNQWKWTLKRHFKPTVFNKLSEKVLQKYADTFNINIAQLKDITQNGN